MQGQQNNSITFANNSNSSNNNSSNSNSKNSNNNSSKPTNNLLLQGKTVNNNNKTVSNDKDKPFKGTIRALNSLQPEDEEAKELSLAPKGLVLVVKEIGQSNLIVGQLVDGNLNPINVSIAMSGDKQAMSGDKQKASLPSPRQLIVQEVIGKNQTSSGQQNNASSSGNNLAKLFFPLNCPLRRSHESFQQIFHLEIFLFGDLLYGRPF